MALINCLALIMSQRPSLARELVPHLAQIDPSLSAAFEPAQLANVRQTLKLALQYIYKCGPHHPLSHALVLCVSTHMNRWSHSDGCRRLPVCGSQGYTGAVGAAIQGIGAQREKSYEESLEEQEQASASSHKRKVSSGFVILLSAKSLLVLFARTDAMCVALNRPMIWSPLVTIRRSRLAGSSSRRPNVLQRSSRRRILSRPLLRQPSPEWVASSHLRLASRAQPQHRPQRACPASVSPAPFPRWRPLLPCLHQVCLLRACRHCVL
jgi:hypothetical protein